MPRSTALPRLAPCRLAPCRLALAAGLALLAAAPGAAGAQGAGRLGAAAGGRGILTGVVTDSSGSRIPGATVQLERGASVVSDDEGRFAIAGLPPGRIGATVRRVGFLPADFELELPAGKQVDVSVRLARSVAALPTVMVDGERRELGLHANGFYDRARGAAGRFLSPEFLDARRAVTLATVLREVPRMQLRCELGGTRCRAAVGTPGRACEPRLWVDGTPAPDGALDEIVPRDRVRGVEVYTGAGFVPGNFQRPGDTCGAIVIWTEFAPTWSRLLPRQRLRLPATEPPPPRVP